MEGTTLTCLETYSDAKKRTLLRAYQVANSVTEKCVSLLCVDCSKGNIAEFYDYTGGPARPVASRGCEARETRFGRRENSVGIAGC
jgi:hypothetical protein